MVEIFYHFVELFATFVEGIIVLSVSSRLATKKYKNNTHIPLLIVTATIYTILVTLMNNWQTFSFLTIGISILYTFIILAIISTGKIILRLTSTMLSWFFMHAIEYIFSYSFVMIIGGSTDISKGISQILNPGITRVCFLITIKLLQFIVFSMFRKLYTKLQLLNKRNLFILLSVTSCSYIVMSVITGLIISDSVLILQTLVIFSLFFIVISLIASIIAITMTSRYQKKIREKELMILTNTMMEKNYIEIQESQKIVRQQVHDFKNHLRTINGMLSQDLSAQEYINKLLKVSYRQAKYCYCQNEIINSIVNCKITEAEIKNIIFEYHINLSDEVKISSIDICAILANQIDNAIEACEKIPQKDKRFIKVEIWQRESFIFFKVINSTLNNPFNDKHQLISTKNDDSGIHGFGIKNISETVSKYDGTLKNQYNNGCFTSVAMLINNE